MEGMANRNANRIGVAAVQMRGEIGRVEENLQKAGRLAAAAAQKGAQLVVLPEVFNTGYEYSDANYALSETPDGPTYTWMRETAARLGVHLAGTFLLRKRGDVYNTLVLVAPDGRSWEYDKWHPWGWERAYFREGEGPVVADTDLGSFGLMICWDVAYPDFFRAYAGRVQMLVICSCPPKMNRMTVHFPGGRELQIGEITPFTRAVEQRGDAVMNEDLLAQGAWMGVPLVNAMQHGRFASGVPRPLLSLALSIMPNPLLWPLLRHWKDATISAPHNEHTLVADAAGSVLTRPGEGDSFALAEVVLPESPPPAPTAPQPKMQMPRMGYGFSELLCRISRPEYERHVSKSRGGR